MQLLKLELYKIFKQKMVWVALIVMLGISFLALQYPYSSAVERDLFKQWEGPLTTEKVTQAKQAYSALLNKEELSKEERIKRELYRKVIITAEIEKGIAGRLDKLEHESDALASKERQMLKDIQLTGISYHAGPGQIVSFVEFGSAFMLSIMLLVGLAPIFSRETSSGVDHYILSSKLGRRSLVWSKIGAACIYTAFIVFMWEALNLVYNYVQHGGQGWSTPLQLLLIPNAGPYYATSPYAFSLLEYHFIQLAIHVVGAIGFALFILFISSISKNSLTTFIVGIFVFFLPALIGITDGEIDAPFPWLQHIVNFSYISVVRVKFLFDEFKAVSLFGIPVVYPVIAVVLVSVLSLVYIKAMLYVMKRKEVSA